jgi:hypothetical protein
VRQLNHWATTWFNNAAKYRTTIAVAEDGGHDVNSIEMEVLQKGTYIRLLQR